jgi:hypothetical protein
MLARFSIGCGRPAGHGDPNTKSIQRPGFANERYVGETSPARHCDIQSGDHCGRYSNYQGPPLIANHPGFANVIAMTTSTTGVDGGGVVRAIFPDGTAYQERDRIGYVDPNVPCKLDRAAAGDTAGSL